MLDEVLQSRDVIGRIFMRLEPGLQTWVDPLAMTLQSDKAFEQYNWLGQVAKMREWKDGRLARKVRSNGMTIYNKEFENTLEITKAEMRRDKTGQIDIRINEFADTALEHWTYLLTDLIVGGASSEAYDGQYFFDTDHAEGNSGTQSNKIQVDISGLPTNLHGTVTDPSTAEMSKSILRSVKTLYGLKDDQGRPLNQMAKNFIVMVPTGLWEAGMSAINNSTIDQGDTNTLRSSGLNIAIVHNALLTAGDTFFTFRTDSPQKPFIKQEEVPVQVSAKAEGSEFEFDNNAHQYGLYMSGNVGYGLWQGAVQTTLI